MSLDIWTTAFSSTTLNKVPVEPKTTLDDGLRVLDGHPVWLSAGTLLGLYRDGDFIPYDTDIDIGYLGDWDDPPEAVDIAALLLENGFHHIRRMTYEDRVMQLAFVKRLTIFDIYFFYKNKEEGIAINYNDNGVMRKPLHLVDPCGKIVWRGTFYPSPAPVEEYLEYRYKDWKTPTGEKRPWFEDAASGLLKTD
jgi:hypothetical protein